MVCLVPSSPLQSRRAGELRALVADLASGSSRGTAPRRGRVAPVAGLVGATVLAVFVHSHGSEFLRATGRALHASWHLLAIAVALEAASVAGYVMLLHRVVSRASPQLRLSDSYDMTLAGAAATRLLPTAGLGGAAVTAWALRARGVRTTELVERLLAFLLLLYAVYMLALFAAGAAVAMGLVRVSSGAELGTVAIGVAGAVAAAIVVAIAAPSRVSRRVGPADQRNSRRGRAVRVLADRRPILRAAARRAWQEVRHPHLELLGAVASWGFDIGVLVTMLHGFAVRLPVAAVVLAYFLGTLLNLVPLPGSLSGGLVGALVALGAPAGAAVAAVLAYRTLAVWLPAAPGVVSLVRLRRSVTSWQAGDEASAGCARRGPSPPLPRRSTSGTMVATCPPGC